MTALSPFPPPDRRAPALDLYWIPLGAGARLVRTSGRVYERIVAWLQRRPRRDLYHAALVVRCGSGRTVIEMTPIPDTSGRAHRGVVAEGPVGSRLLGRFRIFRYEIRRWPGGEIPDLSYAVSSPVLLADDPAVVQRALDAVPFVPTPVWGRDEHRTGEMWNSNSVVAWILTAAGIADRAGAPPGDGRAPGWDAGVVVATAGTGEGGEGSDAPIAALVAGRRVRSG